MDVKGWMDGWMDGCEWMNGWMDGCEWMDVEEKMQMNEWM